MPEQTRIDIELLKKDMSSVTKICEKMDGTIDKVQQVATDLSKIVSLQEQKHGIQDKINESLEKKIEQEHSSTKHEMVKIRSKMDAMSDHLSTKIEKVSEEKRIGYSNLTEKIENSEAKIVEELASIKKDLDKKIYEIDIWRYMVMGGLVLGSFLVTKFLDFAKFFR